MGSLPIVDETKRVDQNMSNNKPVRIHAGSAGYLQVTQLNEVTSVMGMSNEKR